MSRPAMLRWSGPLLIATLLAGAALDLGGAGWTRLKGAAGQWLLQREWRQVEAGHAPQTPWPGARTRPAARLYVPELAIDRLVVDGLDTPNLAWGPGITEGRGGHIVIAAHRDTHFAFLGDLAPGQHLELEYPAGVTRRWRVDDTRIVDARRTGLDLQSPGPRLTLITCWPIDATEAGGPLRLVVHAAPADDRERDS